MAAMHFMVLAGGNKLICRMCFPDLDSSGEPHGRRCPDGVSVKAAICSDAPTPLPAISEVYGDRIVGDSRSHVNGGRDFQVPDLQVDDIIRLDTQLCRGRG